MLNRVRSFMYQRVSSLTMHWWGPDNSLPLGFYYVLQVFTTSTNQYTTWYLGTVLVQQVVDTGIKSIYVTFSRAMIMTKILIAIDWRLKMNSYTEFTECYCWIAWANLLTNFCNWIRLEEEQEKLTVTYKEAWSCLFLCLLENLWLNFISI